MKQFLQNQPVRKLATLTAAVAALAMASTSWADSVKVDYSGAVGNTSGSITIHKPAGGNTPIDVSTTASQFKMTVSSGTSYSDWGNAFGAFCADIYNYLKSSTTYAVSTGAGVWGDSKLISTELRFAQVNWLFDTYALSGSSHVQSGTATQNDAALQMALWEIINETSVSNPLSLTTGNLTITPTSEISVANTWLTAVTDAFSTTGGGLTQTYRSSIYDFFALTANDPKDSQNLLVWRCKNVDPTTGNCGGGGTPSEISEPGTLLLISLGLGVIYFGTRRRHDAYYTSLA